MIRQPLLRPVMIAGSMLMLFETAWTSIQAVFLGGLIGGGLGQVLGVRPALWFCALGSTAATVPLLTMRFRNRTVVSTDTPAPTMAG